MDDVRIGAGLDVHPFADDQRRPLVLAGVRLEGPGLRGHSDADVVAHAVADALLGAVAGGDLGDRFGVDRPETAGADSLGLLETVVREVVGRDADTGWRIGNVDVTVVAQRPHLAPHRDAMRSNLARTLEVSPERVSVKFTTTDRLGAIGRGEGIACWATAALLR